MRVALLEAQAGLKEEGLDQESLRETVVASLVRAGAEIAGETVTFHREDAARRDRQLDRILTSRATGIPVMLCLLAVVFWITIAGANVPSGPPGGRPVLGAGSTYRSLCVLTGPRVAPRRAGAGGLSGAGPG